MEVAEHKGLYENTSNDIKVRVLPQFLDERSDPSRNLFAFAYTITLENLCDYPVQLINRHWKVNSSNRQIADVKGEGVVGEQPVLQKGEVFSYTSWTLIHDPVGSMVGTFTFVSDAGEFFDVEVPEFHLLHVESEQMH